jgi:hypothetical protein
MKTKSISTFLLAAALIAPMTAMADSQSSQNQAGSSSAVVPDNAAPNQSAGTTADQGQYNSSENKAPGMNSTSATDQGGAGTSAGSLSQGAASTKLQGTIQSIDAASNSLTLKTASGAQQVVVPASASIKSKSSNKTVAFANLKKGQHVTAQCDASGNASEVWVK